MSKLSRRVQVLMEEKEFSRLQRLAREKHASVGELIRDGVRFMYLNSPLLTDQKKRQEALQKLFSLHMPVSDWTNMKKKIITSRFSD